MQYIKSQQSQPQLFLYSFLETRFGDPITALDIKSSSLVYGTMLGRLVAFSCPSRQSQIISENSSENITGIYITSPCSFVSSVGDDYVLTYKNDMLINSVPTIIHHKNYENESEHIKYCDNAVTFLFGNVYFKIIIQQPTEGELTITKLNSPYEIKNMTTKSIKTGDIEMTNYVVPFDFDNQRFLWIEFLSDVNRNICTYSFPENEYHSPLMWKFPLNKRFGHISQAKLITNTNTVFIVRNLNQCEIRTCDSAFTVVKAFQHIGDIVIAVDMLITMNNNDSTSSNNSYTNNNINNHNNNAINNNMNNNNNKDYISLSSNDNNNNNGYYYMNSNINNNINDVRTSKQTTKSINVNARNNAIYNNGDFMSPKDKGGNVSLIKEESEHKENLDNSNNNNNVNVIYHNNNNSDQRKDDMKIILLDIDGNVNEYTNGKVKCVFNIYKDVDGVPHEHKVKRLFALGYTYIVKKYKDLYAVSNDFGCYVIKYSNNNNNNNI